MRDGPLIPSTPQLGGDDDSKQTPQAATATTGTVWSDLEQLLVRIQLEAPRVKLLWSNCSQLALRCATAWSIAHSVRQCATQAAAGPNSANPLSQPPAAAARGPLSAPAYGRGVLASTSAQHDAALRRGMLSVLTRIHQHIGLYVAVDLTKFSLSNEVYQRFCELDGELEQALWAWTEQAAADSCSERWSELLSHLKEQWATSKPKYLSSDELLQELEDRHLAIPAGSNLDMILKYRRRNLRRYPIGQLHDPELLLPPPPPERAPRWSPSRPRPVFFLSHRGPDTKEQLVQPLAHLCTQLGIPCFFDQNSEQGRGRHSNEEMATALHGCEVGVVVLSPGFEGSQWCVKEVNALLKRRQEYDHQLHHWQQQQQRQGGRGSIPTVQQRGNDEDETKQQPLSPSVAALGGVGGVLVVPVYYNVGLDHPPYKALKRLAGSIVRPPDLGDRSFLLDTLLPQLLRLDTAGLRAWRLQREMPRREQLVQWLDELERARLQAVDGLAIDRFARVREQQKREILNEVVVKDQRVLMDATDVVQRAIASTDDDTPLES